MTAAPNLQPREATAPRLVNVLHSPKRVRVKFGGRSRLDEFIGTEEKAPTWPPSPAARRTAR